MTYLQYSGDLNTGLVRPTLCSVSDFHTRLKVWFSDAISQSCNLEDSKTGLNNLIFRCHP